MTSVALVAAREMRAMLARPVRKAPKDEPINAFDLSGLDLSSITQAWKDDLVAELSQAFETAISERFPDIDIGRAQELAAAYADERAGLLISGEFDIGSSTIKRVQQLVKNTIENGGSLRDLARALRDDLAFGKERALMIAKTETATAWGQGSRAAAIEQGQDQKAWESQGKSACPECSANEAEGWIGIDAEFSSGNSEIPAHVACECDTIYRTKTLHQDSLALATEARCPSCDWKAGTNVNAGAELYCKRCRRTFTVSIARVPSNVLT